MTTGTLIAEADGARARLLVVLPVGHDVHCFTAERWTGDAWLPVGEKYCTTGVVYDSSAPLNTAVTYRAHLYRLLASPNVLETNDDLITAPVTITIEYTGEGD